VIKSNKLLIVTGPSCAGKSTLTNRILRGECQKLCNQLELGDPLNLQFILNWQFIHRKNIGSNKEQFIDWLMLHIAFNSTSKNITVKIYQELILGSEQVTVLTLCPPADVVFWRAVERMKNDLQIQKLMKGRKLLRLGKKLIKLLINMQQHWNQDNMLVGYEKWFSFLEEVGIERSWLINCISSNVDEAIPFSFESYMLLVNNKHIARATPGL